MQAYEWYSELKKPSWAPPSWLFGPVWIVLYAIIAVSFGSVFYGVFKGNIPGVIAVPFALNLVFNFTFTPIQFGLKNNLLAALDVFLVFATLIWCIVSVWNFSEELHWVVYANIPYMLWVSFAMTLQLTITYLNHKTSALVTEEDAY